MSDLRPSLYVVPFAGSNPGLALDALSIALAVGCDVFGVRGLRLNVGGGNVGGGVYWLRESKV